MSRSLLLFLLVGCQAPEPTLEVAGADAQLRGLGEGLDKAVPHDATRPPPDRRLDRRRRMMGGQEGEPITGAPGVDGATDPDFATGGEDDGDTPPPAPGPPDTGDTGDTDAL